ncbi:unnamed protein product, partial [Musa textilis]
MNGGGGVPHGGSDAAPALGTEPRLASHVCSFCRKHFGSLQSLGGHMTTHRREMEELRRQHEAYMASHRQPRPAAPTPAARSSVRMLRPRHCRLQEARGICMTPLAANSAFWAAYRSADRPPPFIDFMGVMEPEAAPPLLPLPEQEVHQVESSEDTLSD